MYTYMCCKCTNCTARIVLEEWADSGMYLLHRPVRSRPRHQACPYCRTLFAPERYYITESGAPLPVCAPGIELADPSGVFTKTA
jgi:hypothetical protein